MEDDLRTSRTVPRDTTSEKTPGFEAAERTLDFEEALKRLENVVRLLETSELTLKESLELYRQAMALVKICQERLDQAQHSIEEIEADFADPGHREKL